MLIKLSTWSFSRSECRTSLHNSSFERMEQFKYLGATLTHQSSIQEEIKSRLKVGNAFYHSMQKFCLPVFCPKI